MATIGQVMAQKRASDEGTFFTNLLQYATLSDNIVMPNKTDVWNQYVSLKKGRLGPGDIGKFESQYAQIKSLIYQKQLKQLTRFSEGGESDRSIRKKVKDNPEMYKNLLDMASDLKSDTTPEGMAMYAMTKNYLPQKKWYDEWRDDGIPTWARIAAPLGLGTSIYGANLLRQPSAASLEAIEKAKSLKKTYTSDLKGKNQQIKDIKKRIEARKAKVTSLENRKGMKPTNKVLTKARALVNQSNMELKNLQEDLTDLKANKPGKIPKTEPRYKSLKKYTPRGPAASGIGLAALMSAPSVGGYVGEMLGDEEAGREVARTGTNISLLGMAGHTLSKIPAAGPWGIGGRLLGAGLLGIPAGMDLYRQYFGDEE